MVSVTIFVEGGGDQATNIRACREGFSNFFRKAFPDRNQPKVVPCGGRSVVFDKFKRALIAEENAFILLLVDSECAIPSGFGPWEHLRQRAGDEWQRPAGVSDDQAHFMVQCMESWFLADRESLAAFFGKGFHPKALPANRQIEQIDKTDVMQALTSATKRTKSKGVYHKTDHGFRLVALIDPVKVRQSSPQAARLFAILDRKLTMSREVARNRTELEVTSCPGSSLRISPGHGGRHDASPLACGY